MTQLVPTEEIEDRVGAKRHDTLHIARAVDAEQTVYLLHSRECVERYKNEADLDLRDCPFSTALDHGIRAEEWETCLDAPVAVDIFGKGSRRPRLYPLRRVPYVGVSG